METEFKFSRDFKHIEWFNTYKLNFLRALFATPILAVISANSPDVNYFFIFFIYPFIYPILTGPIIYFLFLVIDAICSFMDNHALDLIIGQGIKMVLSLGMIACGDPFVYLLHKLTFKRYPGLVPVRKPGLISFCPIIFVITPPQERLAGLGPGELDELDELDRDEVEDNHQI
ncbi:hypothetical protein [Picosynechococcus sp. NKBG042902]|uniref:hypothetical protein n=1 Tax=Picosynechococcus sp. NKBG042902 TaxID=490193 RepID=UPI0004ABB218|nr:hypothetical protein [Picosynechococcus sp. NKBG042902]